MGDLFGISAGAAALGGGTTQAAGAYFQRKQSVGDTRHARRWQEMMANTAYQRTVADLNAAGLNPALAFGGGSANPVGAPQTQMPQAVDPTGGFNIGGETGRVVSSAIAGKKLADEMKILKNTQEQTYHDAYTAGARSYTAENEARTSNLLPEMANATLRQRLRENDYLEAQTNQARAATRSTEYDNVRRRVEAHIYGGEYGAELRAAEKILDAVPISPLGRFRSSARPPLSRPKNMQGAPTQ